MDGFLSFYGVPAEQRFRFYMVKYTFSTIGKGETSLTAYKDNLHIYTQQTGEIFDIPFKQIKKVKLQYNQGVYYTFLTTSGGRFRIISRSMWQLGKWENKLDDYRNFVRELHKLISDINPEVKYIKGSRLLYLTGWFLMAVGAVGIVLGIITSILVGRSSVFRGTVPFFIAAVMGLPFLVWGKPKIYDPKDIHEDYLPKE